MSLFFCRRDRRWNGDSFTSSSSFPLLKPLSFSFFFFFFRIQTFKPTTSEFRLCSNHKEIHVRQGRLLSLSLIITGFKLEQTFLFWFNNFCFWDTNYLSRQPSNTNVITSLRLDLKEFVFPLYNRYRLPLLLKSVPDSQYLSSRSIFLTSTGIFLPSTYYPFGEYLQVEFYIPSMKWLIIHFRIWILVTDITIIFFCSFCLLLWPSVSKIPFMEFSCPLFNFKLFTLI